MVIANRESICAKNYVQVLKRADLHNAFEQAWGCELTNHDRAEEDLDNISEDMLIKKTLEFAENLWGFSMQMDRSNPTNPEYIYHLIPFEADIPENHKTIQEQELTVLSKSTIRDLDDCIKTIRQNRPDEPEIVSYALDDIERILLEINS